MASPKSTRTLGWTSRASLFNVPNYDAASIRQAKAMSPASSASTVLQQSSIAEEPFNERGGVFRGLMQSGQRMGCRRR